MSQQIKDHYAVLGVPRNASDREIKLAFRKKAKEYHPDTSILSNAEAKFKILNKAYAILKDGNKRQKYNHELMADMIQQQVVNPAKKSMSGFGYSTSTKEDEWGWRVG